MLYMHVLCCRDVYWGKCAKSVHKTHLYCQEAIVRHSLGQSCCKSPLYCIPCCQTDLGWFQRLCAVPVGVHSHVRLSSLAALSVVTTPAISGPGQLAPQLTEPWTYLIKLASYGEVSLTKSSEWYACDGTGGRGGHQSNQVTFVLWKTRISGQHFMAVHSNVVEMFPVRRHHHLSSHATRAIL